MQRKKVWIIVLVFVMVAVIVTGQGALSAKDTAEGTTEQGQQEPVTENTAAEEGQQEPAIGGSEEVETAGSPEKSKTSEDKKASEGETKQTTVLQKTSLKEKKPEKKTGVKTEEGRTELDVSKGNVRIKTTGATGGGLISNETSLNPKGYYITGTTKKYNISIEKNVTTDIILDSVNITCDTTNFDCINVSHANVTMTLIGDNELICNAGNSKDGLFSNLGNAITKDGSDGSLIIQCEFADKANHQCDGNCGTLIARGNKSLYHAGAIGNSTRNCRTEGETGFSNFTIKGGNIKAEAGYHSPGIGAACTSNYGNGKAENISITGGNVKAIGNVYCSGIGGGNAADIDGIYISGGTVEAIGGQNAPGIGSVSALAKNIVISGGDTVVVAIGDAASDAPGIGYTKIPGKEEGYFTGIKNVVASPIKSFQGYIQDGESLTDYTFMEGTPFANDTDIRVGKFYTKVYFGPYRDENTIAKDTKEQIGANHVISKTGGSGFTESQLKELTKVNGKQENGVSFSIDDLTFSDKKQIEKINQAKSAGKIGDYPLTYTTPNGTEVTVNVCLRDSGTDSAQFDPEHPTATIGANDFEKDTGGDAFTEEQMKKYGELKGKDKDGNTISLDVFAVDAEQFQTINEAKTAGKSGVFDLTYTAEDGNKVTVKVSLVGYDEITENPDNNESIKGMNVISKTGGAAFSENQLKELSKVKAFDEHGQEIPAEDLVFSDPDQITLINQAKTAGETGDFSLSFTTPQGTEVTVTVYLRDKGTDGAKEESGNPEPTIAANDASHKTGGFAFTKEELIKLCNAKGKDAFRNNAELSIGKEEMDKLNAAKQAGKTGEFSLTFTMDSGKEAKVTVTLTGEHKVSFNPNGGDYTPKTQTVAGGKQAVEPKEPRRGGYTFEGWYYKDESGKELKWDFNTPVHTSMKLKAKWKKDSGENTESETTQKQNKNRGTKNTGEKTDRYYWDSEDITKNYGNDGSVAKTGDTKHMEAVFFLMSAGGGMVCLIIYRRNRSFKK